MSKNMKSSVMVCGACAVDMNENGEVVTSIDRLVGGVKHLFGKRPHRNVSHEVMATVAR